MAHQDQYSYCMHERPHEKLVVWQEAYKLCHWVYIISKKFPSEERFALMNQIRRAAYSIPMNLAEGNRKSSRKEKRHFFEISLCSLEELHCQTRLAFDLQYISLEDFVQTDDRINRVSYLLNRLRSAFL